MQVRWSTRFPSGPNGERLPAYDVATGCEYGLRHGADRDLAIADLERFLTPADKRHIEEWLAELSVICAKRRDGEFDEALRLEAYTYRLAQYPADVARHAVLRHPWKFWPTWAELEQVCDALAGPRRHMLHALKAPPPAPEPERRPPTAEERAAAVALIAEMFPNVSQATRDEAVSQALAGDYMRAAE